MSTHGDCRNYKPTTKAKRTGYCAKNPDRTIIYRNQPACEDGFEQKKRNRGLMTRLEILDRGNFPCAGLRRDGRPCRAIAPKSHDYCRRHAGQRDGLT